MEAFPPPLPAHPTSRPPLHPARGWLLIVLGTGLSVAMAVLSYVIHQTILRNGEPGSHSHWNGSPEFTRTVFELFGTVFAFGLVALASGIYILRTRRISRVLGGIMVALAVGMGYLGYVIVQTNVPR